MIPHGVEVYVSLDPVNLGLSFDRLAGMVQERMGRSARSAATTSATPAMAAPSRPRAMTTSSA